ncbi:MAG: hypothetical protein M0020_10620 [Actinomycetota bacterium]|nr:hypothetical protein [Actinomycetota bacterium]
MAEAREHATQAQFAKSLPAPERDVHGEWRAGSPPKIDVGFDAPGGPGSATAPIERTAVWGRRLPRAGDLVFVRCPSLALAEAGIAPGRQAAVHLERTQDRFERSIEPSVKRVAPVLTTDTSALQAI